jgi:hypothetical protein
MLAISMALSFIACNNSTSNSKAVESKSTESIVYTCTMHPEVQSDKPGDCPKCGMELVKMEPADSTLMHNQSDTMHMMN